VRDTATYHARHAHSQTVHCLHSHLNVFDILCVFASDREGLG